MPELPDVEICRRTVRDRALRRRVATVSVESPGILEDVSAPTLRRHLKGAAPVGGRIETTTMGGRSTYRCADHQETVG